MLSQISLGQQQQQQGLADSRHLQDHGSSSSYGRGQPASSLPPPSLMSTTGGTQPQLIQASIARSKDVYLTSTTPTSIYYTPATYNHLLAETLGLEANPSAILTYESRRAQACGLVAAVGARIGLPQRTIDSAFIVWNKCGAHQGAASGTAGQQVAIAALFLACKLNDTPKKARELLIASYPLRFPELVRAVPSSSANRDKQMEELAFTSIPESDVDAQMLESERNRVLSLERTLLEVVRYDFKIRQAVESVGRGIMKLGRACKLDKRLIQQAWQLSSDIHRTPTALFYPPLVLSLAALLTAGLLCSSQVDESMESSLQTIERMFKLGPREPAAKTATTNGHAIGTEEHQTPQGTEGQQTQIKARSWLQNDVWEESLGCDREEIEDVVHSVLDLYLSACSSITAIQSGRGSQSSYVSPTSPQTPISPPSPIESSPYDGRVLSSKKTASGSGGGLRLPAWTSNPPPYGVIQWLHEHDGSIPAPSSASTDSQSSASQNGAISSAQGAKTASDFGKVLTDVKIRLRAAEEERRKSQLDESQDYAQDNQSNKRPRHLRRSEIEAEKARVQVLKIQVVRRSTTIDQPAEIVDAQSGQAEASAPSTIAMYMAAEDKSMPPPPVPNKTMDAPGVADASMGEGATPIGSSGQDRTGGSSSKPIKTTRFLF